MARIRHNRRGQVLFECIYRPNPGEQEGVLTSLGVGRGQVEIISAIPIHLPEKTALRLCDEFPIREFNVKGEKVLGGFEILCDAGKAARKKVLEERLKEAKEAKKAADERYHRLHVAPAERLAKAAKEASKEEKVSGEKEKKKK